eukprot:COSAG01_NODE_710_length_14110_cov_94.506745_1_plen_81_part_00
MLRWIREEVEQLQAVSWPFPSWNRSILTEIYLCHACSCQEILRTETAGQGLQTAARAAADRRARQKAVEAGVEAQNLLCT